MRAVVVVPLLILSLAAASVFLLRGERFFYVKAALTKDPPPPQHPVAYELYIRSLGYKREFPTNQQAISLLERSTALDSKSALSWHELSTRYNFEFTNPGGSADPAGGQAFFERAKEANRRALDVAPDFSPARLYQVILEVEGGQVIEAYKAALALTRAHPRDSNAHYALSYVLRQGGMYEESARECDLALKFDPSNDRLLQCGLVNVLLGSYDRVQPFLDPDPLSHLVRYRHLELAILRNDRKAALEEARAIRLGPNTYYDARMLEAALGGADPETVREWSHKAEALFDRGNTAEFYFVEARYHSYAGQTEPALRLLRRAIANNYCSYPVMDSDPFLANIRKLSEYKELKQAGIACREKFRSQMTESQR